MTDKVVGLDGKAVDADPDYNTSVITLLETALADAKKHKAFGVTIALVMPTAKDEGGGSFDVDCYWHGGRLLLLAATSRMTHRINLKCDETTVIPCD